MATGGASGSEEGGAQEIWWSVKDAKADPTYSHKWRHVVDSMLVRAGLLSHENGIPSP